MAIKFVRKFGSGLSPKNPEPKEKGSMFDKLNKKLKYERECIQPHLKDLFGLYNDRCVIFDGNNYVGQSRYSFRSGKIEDYDEIGKILAQI